MKTFSGRVLCFAMASSTIETATSAGLSVLGRSIDILTVLLLGRGRPREGAAP